MDETTEYPSPEPLDLNCKKKTMRVRIDCSPIIDVGAMDEGGRCAAHRVCERVWRKEVEEDRRANPEPIRKAGLGRWPLLRLVPTALVLQHLSVCVEAKLDAEGGRVDCRDAAKGRKPMDIHQQAA